MRRAALFTWILLTALAGKPQSPLTTKTNADGKVSAISKGGDKNVSTPSYIELAEQSEIPNDIHINHIGYTLSYNPNYRLASWVSYRLTKEMLLKSPRFGKKNKFKRDPGVSPPISAINADYVNSNYVRGQLCPTADMAHSENTMEETYYYSNISPQRTGFNTGIWLKVENQVRTWTIENDTLYVVSGPILQDDGVSRENDLFVPKYYYKVILDYRLPGIKGIGFIVPNETSAEDISHFAVSIDSVESATGIDFFPALPDDQEKCIEESYDLGNWATPFLKPNSGKP